MLRLSVMVALLVAGLSVLVMEQPAEARLMGRAAVAAPDCCPPVCPTPCITYRHHGPSKSCCSQPPIETVLCVKDPCRCGCEVMVPVCLPACCLDEVPKVSSRCGLLGRGVVTYQYCCGFTVRVVFQRCGNVVVHTYGSY
jgi:hypothetical protein